MTDQLLDAEVQIAQMTNSNYIIRIEGSSGITEVILTPTEFAKAVTGKLAKGKLSK